MSKRLIHDRDRVLLLSSSVFESTCEDYPWFKKFIEDNPKATNDSLEDGVIKDFFRYRYQRILKQAISEWVPHSTDPIERKEKEENFRCELCNQPIQKVCCIVNSINNNELRIGSECVKRYKMSFYGKVEKLFKEQKRMQRINILEKIMPGIENEVARWTDFVKVTTILIPNRMEIPYLKLGDKAKEAFDTFVDEGYDTTKDQQIIDQLKEYIDQKKEQMQEINNYRELNKDNKFIPKTPVVKWIKNQMQIRPKDARTTLQWLKEDGKITMRTALRIGEQGFLESLVEEFGEIFNGTTWNIKGLKERQSRFGYVVNAMELNVSVFCEFSDFIYKFGDGIFNKEVKTDLNEKALLEIGELYESRDVEYFLSIVERLMPNNYGIYRHDIDMDEIIFVQHTNDMYITKKLSDFTNRFKNLLIISEQKSIMEAFHSYFVSMDKEKKFSKKDIDTLLEMR